MTKAKKIVRKLSGLVLVIVGMAIGGFGVSMFLPQKQYAGGDISVKTLPSGKEDEQEENN